MTTLYIRWSSSNLHLNLSLVQLQGFFSINTRFLTMTCLRILLCAALLPVIAGVGHSSCDLKRVCYFTNWAQYRSGGAKFVPSDVDPNLCSHLIYAFARIDPSFSIVTTEWNDLTLYPQVMSLKSINPNLKVLLAVGGWGRSADFIAMSMTDANILQFANNTISYLRQHGFDGIDLDWEYPSTSGQVDRHTALMTILREEFENEVRSGQDKLLLTAAVSAGQITIDNSYNITQLNQAVDFLNVMTYDFVGTWSLPRTVAHHSPLYAWDGDLTERANFTADWAMRYWVEQGADPKKLVMGLAAYGRSFALSNPSDPSYGAVFSGPSQAGPYTRTPGWLSYTEICPMVEDGTLTVVRMNDTKVPYAYGMVGGVSTWIAYDDIESFSEKLQYVLDNGYGGAMVWSVSYDDFNGGFCSNGSYPLISLFNNFLTCANSSVTPPPTTSPTTSMTTPTTTSMTTPTTTSMTTTTSVPTTTTPPVFDSVTALAASCSDGGWTHGGLSEDCSVFYKCDHGQVVNFTCAPPLAYDSRYSVCNWRYLVPGC